MAGEGALDELMEERDLLLAERDRLAVEREQIASERDAVQLERERYHRLYLEMLEINARLERGLVGQKRERHLDSDVQLSLLVLQQLVGLEPTTPTEEPERKHTVAGHERRKPGRRPLPENLPRIEFELIPDEVKRAGLDAFERIGEEVNETLERRAASLVVVRVIRPKFVAKDRVVNSATAVHIAAAVELPIERGLAGPNFLAETIVRRWDDHCPANRQEKMYAREGLDIARSTICRMHMALAALAAPLIVEMWKDAARKSAYLCADATGVLIQHKDKCERGHFWVVVAPALHVLFAFSRVHDSAAVDEIFERLGFAGYLCVDAHSVYEHLFLDGTIIEVGCWAHARRYFTKCLVSEPERAKQALTLIGGLFAIERELVNATPKRRKLERGKRSKPILDAVHRWCEDQAEYALDDTPLKAALTYAHNQKDALARFLEDGRLPIHNNGSELQLRREAIGRKNWLFVANDAGAAANTTFVTLLASCAMHKLDPQAYLRDLFCLLPSWPRNRILELAPAYWKATLEQPETQQRLAANIFRTVAMGEREPDG